MVGTGIVVDALNEDFLASDGIKEFGVFDDEWIEGGMDGLEGDGSAKQRQEHG